MYGGVAPQTGNNIMTTKDDEKEYPKSSGNSSSTMPAYSVEGRYNYSAPQEIAGQIFDNRWRRVIFNEGDAGVPIGSEFHINELRQYSVMGYSAAQALRWWLHAVADAGCSMSTGLCLETKIVKHIIKTSSECEAVSEHDIISGEDRTSMMPDYGEQST